MIAWQQNFIQQLSMLPMQQLEQLFALSKLPAWPNASGLNDLRRALGRQGQAIPKFVCQSQVAETSLYYEQLIYRQHIIPTRPDSWHDLFNGLIWLQFPSSKGLLNQQHVADISEFGLTPRTVRRNNITHFDECGVILTYEKGSVAEQLIEDLAKHRWHSVFVQNRQVWGKELNSFMFGHANLEMLLQPFIGLTGKWLALEVSHHFSEASYSEQVSQLDEQLVTLITQTDIFATNKPLAPIPLLGIPRVWDANTDPDFYNNTDYFRPLPKPRKK